jgi:hypothetical protein
MKLPRTVGLAVAVSLVVATVAAALAWISGSAPGGPTANVVDADVSLIKPLPRTEQFEKRGYAVPLPLSETTHGPWYEMSNGLFDRRNISSKETNNGGDNSDEGDRGDGPGCGDGRDDAGGAAGAAGSDKRRRRSGSCVGIHLG